MEEGWWGLLWLLGWAAGLLELDWLSVGLGLAEWWGIGWGGLWCECSGKGLGVGAGGWVLGLTGTWFGCRTKGI